MSKPARAYAAPSAGTSPGIETACERMVESGSKDRFVPGEALGDRRDDLFLVSKACPHDAPPVKQDARPTRSSTIRRGVGPSTHRCRGSRPAAFP